MCHFSASSSNFNSIILTFCCIIVVTSVKISHVYSKESRTSDVHSLLNGISSCDSGHDVDDDVQLSSGSCIFTPQALFLSGTISNNPL